MNILDGESSVLQWKPTMQDMIAFWSIPCIFVHKQSLFQDNDHETNNKHQTIENVRGADMYVYMVS